MADSRIDETVYIAIKDLPAVGPDYGNVGVVIYSKSFSSNGVQIWMVPG